MARISQRQPKNCEWCGVRIIVRHCTLEAWKKKRFCSRQCHGFARRRTLLERIRASTIIDPNTGCWNCRGYLMNGYGQLITDKTRLAHVVAWELVNGRVSPGFELHHICENRQCCNPAHLEPVTPHEHRLKHKKAYCCRGHPFTEENTYVWKDGYRHCRICKRIRNYERKRSATKN